MKSVHEGDFLMKDHFFLKEEKRSYVCPTCLKTCNDKSNFNRHLSTHNNNVYACNQCEKMYEFKPSLLRHQKTHENPELFSCKKCSKILSSKSRLSNHMQVFHEDDTDEIESPPTVIQFKGMYRTFADIPEVIIENKNTSKTCPTCNKSFATNSTLKRHQLKHQNNNSEVVGNENLRCTECKKYYNHVGNFNRHMKSKTEIISS